MPRSLCGVDVECALDCGIAVINPAVLLVDKSEAKVFLCWTVDKTVD
jgi:hypothetical protein